MKINVEDLKMSTEKGFSCALSSLSQQEAYFNVFVLCLLGSSWIEGECGCFS